MEDSTPIRSRTQIGGKRENLFIDRRDIAPNIFGISRKYKSPLFYFLIGSSAVANNHLVATLSVILLFYIETI